MSATVSTMLICQLAMRLSTTSIDGRANSTARMISAKPCGALSRSRPITSATSASARGWMRRDAGMSTPSPNSVSAKRVPKSGWSTPICCCTAFDVTPILRPEMR